MMSNIIRFQTSSIEPYPLQVQGESNYRRNIEDVSNYTGEDEGVNADDFIAHLILDDSNQYDPGNAVRVDIDGKTVGYLSKVSAKAYRKRLAELGLFDVIGECYASIRGGFITRDGAQADFGVRLDLDLDTFNVPSAKQEPKLVDRAPAVEPGPAISGPTYMGSPPSSPTSPVKKLRDWFFAPSKNRAWRIALFVFLSLCLCGACLTIIPAIIAGNP